MAGCCECGDEPSGSCATELVIKLCDFVSLVLHILLLYSEHLIYVFIKLVWSKEFPRQWKESIVVPINKMGDITD
jgi:hypothetical protein